MRPRSATNRRENRGPLRSERIDSLRPFTSAVDCFRTYESLSFGDATIAVYMKREGIEYLYSFDDDFDAVQGITRPETADDSCR
ncbi:PIN domain-containing protein [Halorubrum ruber]|uniref:PIN domain-containing protein n=1 Tax=Halorubrum ruber TaxID=2982524 RepID=A0A8T8LK89_9EURY|nr:PIN domain-containing protein [Halorubrum ruber]